MSPTATPTTDLLPNVCYIVRYFPEKLSMSEVCDSSEIEKGRTDPPARAARMAARGRRARPPARGPASSRAAPDESCEFRAYRARDDVSKRCGPPRLVRARFSVRVSSLTLVPQRCFATMRPERVQALEIDQIRWWVVTRYTTRDATQFRDAWAPPPDTNARCTAMMIRPYNA